MDCCSDNSSKRGEVGADNSLSSKISWSLGVGGIIKSSVIEGDDENSSGIITSLWLGKLFSTVENNGLPGEEAKSEKSDWSLKISSWTWTSLVDKRRISDSSLKTSPSGKRSLDCSRSCSWINELVEDKEDIEKADESER